MSDIDELEKKCAKLQYVLGTLITWMDDLGEHGQTQLLGILHDDSATQDWQSFNPATPKGEL